MPKAYSYVRFSTPEQAKGHSISRQVDLARAYAAKKGLQLDEHLTFKDLGVSAFKALNAHEGQLRAFRRAVEDGLVESGSVLLVENLDRISRADAYSSLAIVQEILNLGIRIVTLHNEREYSVANLKEHPWSIMEIVMEFIRANEESATKSKRLKAVWESKKRKAAELGVPLTSRTPAWIELIDGAYRLIPERASIVTRIFEEAVRGVGQNLIAQRLNGDGVPVFGRGRHWHRSYIVKLLHNPAVIGTYVPHSNDHSGSKLRRRAEEPVPDYYPKAVSTDTFNAVQALTSGGASSPRRGRHAASDVQNILGGLARCCLCGGSMTRVSKGKATHPYLVCAAAKVGAGCKYAALPYSIVEEAIVSQRREVQRTSPKSDQDVLDELDAVETAIAELGEHVRRALSGRSSFNKSKTLQAAIGDAEAQLVDLEVQRHTLQQRAAATSLGYINHRVAQLDHEFEQQSPGWRGRANSLLRQLFRSVVLDPSKGDIKFVWKAGRETSLSFFMPEKIR